MAPAVEILVFPTSEAYRKDPSLLHPVFDILNKWKGSLGVYHGVQVEDGKTGYLFIVWESVKDHQDLIDDAIYPEVLAGLKPCVGPDGKPDLTHVHYEPAAGLAGILNAPVTSLALITKLNEGKTEADLANAMSSLFSAQDVKGCHGAAWGKKVEREEWTFVTAWDKVEDHSLARAEHKGIQEFLSKLREVAAEWGATHVKLTSYGKKL